ncbi:MAG: methionyl-tRNA formyltransferase [bacterium]|nr:methionyl-tRNA formyltransferase [bacterium]
MSQTSNRKFKIAYFGTPDFAAEFLEKILLDTNIPVEIKMVVTQPDKPVGRKQIITKSPVKIIAEKHNLPVFDEINNECKKLLADVDFALVFAYGFKTLIPEKVLQLTKHKFGNTNSGFINIHPSLLPKYRGATPIAYPILLGDTETGVSIFVMDEKMDHGPLLIQEKINIPKNALRPEMEQKLSNYAYEVFKKLIMNLSEDIRFGATWEVHSEASTPFGAEKRDIELKIQEHVKATHARFMTKQDGFIPLSVLQKTLNNEPLTIEEVPAILKEYIEKNNLIENSSKLIFNLFRGLYPWPGIWTQFQLRHLHRNNKLRWLDGERLKRLKITEMELFNNKLVIKKVQLEGKNEVDFETFQKAYMIF